MSTIRIFASYLLIHNHYGALENACTGLALAYLNRNQNITLNRINFIAMFCLLIKLLLLLLIVTHSLTHSLTHCCA